MLATCHATPRRGFGLRDMQFFFTDHADRDRAVHRLLGLPVPLEYVQTYVQDTEGERSDEVDCQITRRAE